MDKGTAALVMAGGFTTLGYIAAFGSEGNAKRCVEESNDFTHWAASRSRSQDTVKSRDLAIENGSFLACSAVAVALEQVLSLTTFHIPQPIANPAQWENCDMATLCQRKCQWLIPVGYPHTC